MGNTTTSNAPADVSTTTVDLDKKEVIKCPTLNVVKEDIKLEKEQDMKNDGVKQLRKVTSLMLDSVYPRIVAYGKLDPAFIEMWGQPDLKDAYAQVSAETAELLEGRKEFRKIVRGKKLIIWDEMYGHLKQIAYEKLVPWQSITFAYVERFIKPLLKSSLAAILPDYEMIQISCDEFAIIPALTDKQIQALTDQLDKPSDLPPNVLCTFCDQYDESLIQKKTYQRRFFEQLDKKLSCAQLVIVDLVTKEPSTVGISAVAVYNNIFSAESLFTASSIAQKPVSKHECSKPCQVCSHLLTKTQLDVNKPYFVYTTV